MLPDECVWIISVLSQSGRSIPGGIIHKNSPCDRKTFLSSQLEPKLPYVQCRVWKKLEVSSWFVFFWWVLKNEQKKLWHQFVVLLICSGNTLTSNETKTPQISGAPCSSDLMSLMWFIMAPHNLFCSLAAFQSVWCFCADPRARRCTECGFCH